MGGSCARHFQSSRKAGRVGREGVWPHREAWRGKVKDRGVTRELGSERVWGQLGWWNSLRKERVTTVKPSQLAPACTLRHPEVLRFPLPSKLEAWSLPPAPQLYSSPLLITLQFLLFSSFLFLFFKNYYYWYIFAKWGINVWGSPQLPSQSQKVGLLQNRLQKGGCNSGF